MTLFLGLFGAARFGWGQAAAPLAPVLADRLLIPLGAATCAVAILALVLRLTSGVAPSTVTGIGAGALLTSYALGTLIAALARRPPAPVKTSET